MRAYRFALFLGDLAWRDMTTLKEKAANYPVFPFDF